MNSGTKIFSLILLFTLLPFLIVFIIYDYSSLNTTTNNVRDLATELVAQKAEKINERISYVESLQRTTVNDNSILELLMRFENEEPIEKALQISKLKAYFNAIIYNDHFVKSIIVNLPEGETLTFGRGTYSGYVDNDVTKLSNFTLTNDFIRGIQGRHTWIASEIENGKNIYLIGNIKYFAYAKSLGTIVFLVDKNEFFQDALDIENGDSLILEKEVPIYGAGTPSESHIRFSDLSLGENKNGQYYIVKDLSFKWNLSVAIDEHKMLNPITSARNMMLGVIASGIIVSIFFSKMITLSIQNKIRIIKSNFDKLENADFNVVKRLRSDDEFSQIENDQIDFGKKLDQLIQQNYQNKIITKDAVIRSLEYQVSPHFLYNTLEIINSLALENRNTEIRVVTQSLAGLFRYNLKESYLVKLATEIEHSKEYVNIEKYHLKYALDVFFEITVHNTNQQVIKFLIQPLIENSIKHGFAKRLDPATIEIHIIEQDHFIELTVMDDGLGIANEQLDALNRGISSNTMYNEKIGLKNVYQRLQTIYGGNFEMNISSEEGLGASVYIKFPVKLEGIK